MNGTAPNALLPALQRESAFLLDYSLEVFLEIDFLAHNILEGRLTAGHVVTYLAREADRMADELLAATGQLVPEPDRIRRWEIAEGGNERPGAVMVDDIHESTARLQDAVASVPDWSSLSDDVRGIPARRLLQLVIHLADLGRAWDSLADDDATAAASVLPKILGQELAAYRLTIDESAQRLSWSDADADADAGAGADGIVEVSGPARLLLAWATGRTEGLELATHLPLPTLRVWI